MICKSLGCESLMKLRVRKDDEKEVTDTKILSGSGMGVIFMVRYASQDVTHQLIGIST